jgi:hypothetical protein
VRAMQRGMSILWRAVIELTKVVDATLAIDPAPCKTLNWLTE